MLFPRRPKNRTFLPLISPVASLSKISPRFLQTDSPGGGMIAGTFHQPGALDNQSPPHLGQDGSCPPTSILNLPRWLLSLWSILLLGAGSWPAAAAWCPDQAHLPLGADFSRGSVPKGLSFPPQLGEGPAPSQVQCHPIRISRKGSGAWRSADLPGNLRVQELLTGCSTESPRGSAPGLTHTH